MEETEIYSLIVRYLAQQTTLEENEKLADWLARSERNELEFEQIKTLWLAAGEPDAGTDAAQQALARTKARYHIPLPGEATADAVAVQPVRRIRSWYYGAAAAAAVVIGVVAFFLQQPAHAPGPPSIVYVEQHTEARQKLKLRLTDSTIVYLAPRSKIRYPERFTGDSRTVYLEGEAFFEVKRDTLRPFLVHSGQLTTRVLGTTFNIKAFAERPDIRVSLFSGKVEVFDTSAPDRAYPLHPGDQLHFDKQAQRMAVQPFDQASVKGWVSNKLIFRNASLGDAIHSIESFYGVTFVLKDPRIADTQLWASFDNEPLEKILEYLALAGKIQSRRTGDTIYLTKKN